MRRNCWPFLVERETRTSKYIYFFYDTDERRRYTKKVHPLKAWVRPSIVKRGSEEEGIYGLGRSWRYLWMWVLKQLKVINRGEDGGWEWVPISGGQRDKRVGVSIGSIFIQFDSEGVLSVRKPRVSSKGGWLLNFIRSHLKY